MLYFLFNVHRLAVEFRNTLYVTKTYSQSATWKMVYVYFE